jgi:ankyrin repeat protein
MPPKFGPSDAELEKKLFKAISKGDPIGIMAILKLFKFGVNHKNEHGYMMTQPPIGDLLGLYNYIDSGYQATSKLDPNKADGCTPLHCAVVYGKIPVIELLLKEGADPQIENAFGVKAFDLDKCFSPDDIKLMPKIKLHSEFLKAHLEKK